MTGMKYYCLRNAVNVLGTLSIFDHDAHVLIDTGAQRSFVSETFAQYSNCELSPLEEELLIRTPLGENLGRTMVYKNCAVKLGWRLI